MSIATDILTRVKASGAELILKSDGTGIKARNISVGLLDEVRQHKPEILELLKTNSSSGNAVPLPKPPLALSPVAVLATPKTFTRLELATDALAKLIPDEQQRRKIRALALADAKGWQFLGATGYQHVLSGSIMDAVEAATGKLICFTGCDTPDRFAGWFTTPMDPPEPVPPKTHNQIPPKSTQGKLL